MNLKDLLIPHEGNNYAPHSLQKAAVLGMLFLIILSFTLSNALSLLWTNSQWMVSTILPAVIVDRTNQERSAESLGILKRSAVLDAAAQMKANDMSKNGYFAHYSPAGISPWYWFAQAKYNFIHAGENLAIYFTDSDAIVKAWMASPTHRENIMNGNFTEIGIGTAKGKYQGFDTVYVVQLFGAPAKAAIPKPIVAGEATSAPAVVPDTKTDTKVLAQKVSLTESSVRTQDLVATTSQERIGNTATTTLPKTAIIQNTETTSTPRVVYSDFIATSTQGIAALSDPATLVQNTSIPGIVKAMTRSQFLLQVLYSIIALFVCVALLFSVLIEIKHQQPMQIAYSICLLMVMGGLLYLHIFLTSGALIV